MTMKYWCICLAFLLSVPAAQGAVREQLRKGGKFYNDGKYGSALNSYQNILKEHPHNQAALFNAANAYYRLNDYTHAQEAYAQAAQEEGDLSQHALFNLGNAYYRSGDKQQAIESFKQAVLQNPQDKEAIHNLQLVLKEQKQQNDNQNNNNNQSSDSDNRNQQQENNQGQAPQQQQPQQQPQDRPEQMDKNAADRVMSMAKENEYRRSAPAGRQLEQTVEKDW